MTPLPASPASGGGARGGRTEILAALAVGAAVFAIYAATAFPGVPGGDAGELIGAAASGGVAHPPGFPLYLLLGRLAALLPWGPLAFRFNLLSSACGAGAAALLFASASRWTGSARSALVATSLFAFAPTVWRWAIGAEVFALNDLLVALLLYCAVRFAEARERHWALAGAFVFGLCLSNHHQSLLSALPLIAGVLWQAPELARGRSLASLLGAFALGLTPYLYLPFAGAHPAMVSWGLTQTWAGFWTHVSRHEYGTFRLSIDAGSPGFGAVLAAWARSLQRDLAWRGLVPVLGGAVLALRGRKSSAQSLSILAAALVPVLVFCVLGNLPLTDPMKEATYARFWQQPLLFFCMLASQAMAAVFVRFRRPWVAAIVCGLATALAPVLRFRAQNHHQDRMVEAYGAEMLRVAPPGALLIARGDLIVNVLRYLQLGEKLRPDVRVVPDFFGFFWGRERLERTQPDVLIPPWAPRPGGIPGDIDPVAFVDANVARAPVMLCGDLETAYPGIAMHHALWPLGLCKLVRPAGETPDAAAIDQWVASSEAAVPRLPPGPHPPGSWEEVAFGDCFAARQQRALKLMDLAGRDPARRPYLDLAAKIMEGILAEDPAPVPPLYRSLAVIYGRLGTDTPEERARTAEAWRRYLEVAPPYDPQLGAIRAELQRLLDPLPAGK